MNEVNVKRATTVDIKVVDMNKVDVKTAISFGMNQGDVKPIAPFRLQGIRTHSVLNGVQFSEIKIKINFRRFINVFEELSYL